MDNTDSPETHPANITLDWLLQEEARLADPLVCAMQKILMEKDARREWITNYERICRYRAVASFNLYNGPGRMLTGFRTLVGGLYPLIGVWIDPPLRYVAWRLYAACVQRDNVPCAIDWETARVAEQWIIRLLKAEEDITRSLAGLGYLNARIDIVYPYQKHVNVRVHCPVPADLPANRVDLWRFERGRALQELFEPSTTTMDLHDTALATLLFTPLRRMENDLMRAYLTLLMEGLNAMSIGYATDCAADILRVLNGSPRQEEDPEEEEVYEEDP